MENFESRQTPETEIEENTFSQAIEQYAVGEIETDFDEQAVARLQESLEQTKLFLLGEMHGVAENPNIIYRLFKKFGFKRVALEWNGQKLQDIVNTFLATGYLDLEAIKDSGDGRITAGHFALLKKLKEEGLLEDIILFDANEEDWNHGADYRDKVMADNVLADGVEEKTLVIAGNWHAKVDPITSTGEEELHHPMGEHIKGKFPELSSGKIKYHSGQFFNNGTKDFWNDPDQDTIKRAQFYQSEDGLYYYAIPEAHLAIVPNPKEVNMDDEIEKPAILYHASLVKNLDQLNPDNKTTRDENEGKVIFAGANLAEVSRFLVPTDDSWTLIATYNNIPTMIIRDEHRFRELDKGGTIYQLPSDTFAINNPDHPNEWTSSEPVKPLDEKIEVESALDMMIDNGVQVYFVDDATFERIKEVEDKGYIILNTLESENKRLGKNSVVIPEEI